MGQPQTGPHGHEGSLDCMRCTYLGFLFIIFAITICYVEIGSICACTLLLLFFEKEIKLKCLEFRLALRCKAAHKIGPGALGGRHHKVGASERDLSPPGEAILGDRSMHWCWIGYFMFYELRYSGWFP